MPHPAAFEAEGELAANIARHPHGVWEGESDPSKSLNRHLRRRKLELRSNAPPDLRQNGEMSVALTPSGYPSPKKKAPRASAAVMLTRGSGEGTEVYFVQRSLKLRFFGGSWAFPGGVLDASDVKLAALLPTAEASANDPEMPDIDALLVCALRELFEETGVLLEPLASALASKEERTELRAGLMPRAGATPESIAMWEALCAPFARAGTLLSSVQPIGRITTPAFRPLRYHTLFLQADLPMGELPEIITGELEDGRFDKPADALNSWKRGEKDVVPPVLFLLEMLSDELAKVDSSMARFRDFAGAAFDEIARGKLHAAYTSPGILAAPLRTPTLPPAETTNTYLVGTGDIFVVDPATYEDTERARLYETLDEWAAAGRTVRGVILTHRHADHIGSAYAVSHRYSVPVMAHRQTLADLDDLWEDPEMGLGGRPAELRELAEADRVDLGIAPDGSPDWHLTVRHTPGHALGHISLHDSRYGTAIVGDMVSTISTIVIDPKEGHLATYLHSLQRLIDVAPNPTWALLPAHGPWASDGTRLVQRYLDHRGEREASLRRALKSGLETPAELVAMVYADTPEVLWPYAELSLHAGLIKLEEEGLATLLGDKWRPAITPS